MNLETKEVVSTILFTNDRIARALSLAESDPSHFAFPLAIAPIITPAQQCPVPHLHVRSSTFTGHYNETSRNDAVKNPPIPQQILAFNIPHPIFV